MNRDALYAVLANFLEALNAGDASRVNWAASPLNSENNVMLEVGDGLWGTILRVGD